MISEGDEGSIVLLGTHGPFLVEAFVLDGMVNYWETVVISD